LTIKSIPTINFPPRPQKRRRNFEYFCHDIASFIYSSNNIINM